MNTRTPPTVMLAEQALLGEIIRRPGALKETGHLAPGHFADPIPGRIYESIQTRCATGLPFDVDALREDFALSGLLDEVGGVRYLAQLLVQPCPDVSVAAASIEDCWRRRCLLALLEQLARETEEWALDAALFTSRQSGQQIANVALGRLGELYTLLGDVAAPVPAELRPIDDVAQVVVLAPSELLELSELHVVLAQKEEGTPSADLRLARAEQLRGMLGEARP